MSTSPQDPQQRYAPPTAEVADVPANGQSQLAGRGVRLLAAIIDTIILLVLWWVVGKLTPLNIYSPGMANAGFISLIGYGLAGVLLFTLVNGWLLATRGQTIGKMSLGLRITRRDGSAADLLRLVGLRYGIGALITAVPVIGMFYALVDVLFIFRNDRRCVHDLVADTIVVKA